MNILFSHKPPLPPIDWWWLQFWGMAILFCGMIWLLIVALVFGL